MPFFTLVMPVYNQAAHLDSALSCVYQQTLQDYEFIVVDGGSMDGSLERLAREEAQGRLHLIEAAIDTPVHEACNLGARLASGRWLVFFDPQDLLLFDHLSGFADAIAAHPHLSLFVNGHQRMEGHQRAPRASCALRGVLTRQQALAAFARCDYLHFNGGCFRREWFLAQGGFPAVQPARGVAACFWLRTLCALEAVHYDDTVTSLWVVTPEGRRHGGALPEGPHPCVTLQPQLEPGLARCERHYLRAAINRQILDWAADKKRQGQQITPDLASLRVAALRPRHLYQALTLLMPRPAFVKLYRV
ncbi:glycosyltransferase family 2 protein [Halomonas organivorans]